VWEHVQTLRPLLDGLERRGERPALLAFSRAGCRSWSFSALAAESRRLAQGLRAAGIGPGHPVALWAGPGPEWVLVCLGIIAAGATVVPLDTQFPERTLIQVLKDSKTRLIFTERKKRSRLTELPMQPPPAIALLDAGEGDPDSWRRYFAEQGAEVPAPQPDDTVALFYTSGTTGPPKGVPLTQRNLAVQLTVLEQADFLRSDDRVLLPLPLHHVYPFVMGVLAPLGLGLPLILPQGLTGPQILRALQEGRASLIIGVPRLYAALLSGIEARVSFAGRWALGLFHALLSLSVGLHRTLRLPLGQLLFRPIRRRFGPRLRLLASGGAQMNPRLGERLEALGWPVAVGYGLTETSPLITLRLPGTGPLTGVGKPVPGVEVRFDSTALPGDSAERGRAGELLVRGPNVFHGYHGLPEKTREAFTDGWFRTGDLARMDRHGQLQLLGRASTLIVTQGGENVQPEEVEEVYQSHPAIAEVGVLQRDGALVGVIVPELREVRGVEDPEQRVRAAVSEVSRRLPSYQRLSDVAITREPLERTRLGKLRRHLLADRFEKARAETVRAPAGGPMEVADMRAEDRELLEDPVAGKVWQWLAQRYPDKPLTPDSSPQLDLGVDSMEWVNLTMEIGQRTGIELGDEAIAGTETVRDLLVAATEGSSDEQGAEGVAGALREPERVLGESELRWLGRPGPVRRSTFFLLALLNSALIRMLFRVEVKGVERLAPDTPYLIAPNHLSYLDPFVLAHALGYRRLRRTYWAGFTGAAFANPLQRLGSRLAQAVPVDPVRGVIASLALAAAVLKSGRNLVWFPEGGRARDGRLQPLKQGTGVLLEHHPVSVIPVAIRGTFELMPTGRKLPRPGRIRIEFGAPVETDTLAAEGEGDGKAERIVAGLEKRLRALVGNPK
jgi:long-chain acyl-CoA synthetase